MSLLTDMNDNKEPSQRIFEAEDRLTNIKKEKENIEYMCKLVETDTYLTYKKCVSYALVFSSNIMYKAWLWSCMLENGKDNDSNPIDKRKNMKRKDVMGIYSMN